MLTYPTYRVELAGDEPEVFEAVYVDLMLGEADRLMQWTGLTWTQWLQGVDDRVPDALRFMYWLSRSRAGRPVEGKFSDIEFYLHAMTVTLVDAGDFAPADDAGGQGTPEVTGPDPTQGGQTESG